MRKHVYTVAASDPRAAVEFVAARLGVDRATAAAHLAAGAVSVDNRRADAATTLRPGARVLVREPAPVAAQPWREVHRDASLLVVDKPAGMLSQPSPGESAGALSVEVAARSPGAHLVHRLDRDASGLVLFALDATARAALQAALADGTLEREYLARVAGTLRDATDIELRIGRDAHDATRRIALPAHAPGGQPAHTRVEPLAHLDGETLVRARLHTGRTHQIRVHLAAVGHPLVGDRRYGGPPAARLMLHAWRLAFAHPTRGATVRFESPPPPELAPPVDDIAP